MLKKILCVGHCVLDRVYELTEIPSTPRKVDALNSRESGGGPASTAAVAISCLGGNTSFIGYLGNDAVGASLIKKLADKGVDATQVIVIEGGRTVAPIVLVDGNGERCIIVHRHHVDVPSEKIKFDLSNTDLLLVDTRWIRGSLAAAQEARKFRIPIIVDVDGGKREDIMKLLSLGDHSIFSDQGLYDCTSQGDVETRLREIKNFCSGILAVTAGSAGSYWLLGEDIHHIPAFKVIPLDTTGCGDVFHGTYALGITENMSPLRAARFASAAAALKAAKGNGWDGMPKRSEIEELLATVS